MTINKQTIEWLHKHSWGDNRIYIHENRTNIEMMFAVDALRHNLIEPEKAIAKGTWLEEVHEYTEYDSFVYRLTSLGEAVLSQAQTIETADSTSKLPLSLERHILEYLYHTEPFITEGKRTTITIHEWLQKNVDGGEYLEYMEVSNALDRMTANNQIEGTSIWGTTAYRYPHMTESQPAHEVSDDNGTAPAATDYFVQRSRVHGGRLGYGIVSSITHNVVRKTESQAYADYVVKSWNSRATAMSEGTFIDHLITELNTANTKIADLEAQLQQAHRHGAKWEDVSSQIENKAKEAQRNLVEAEPCSGITEQAIREIRAIILNADTAD